MSVSNGWKSYFGENIKSGDITDMFNKYRSRSPKVACKTGVLDSFAKMSESLIKKVAGYWLIKTK